MSYQYQHQQRGFPLPATEVDNGGVCKRGASRTEVRCDGVRTFIVQWSQCLALWLCRPKNVLLDKLCLRLRRELNTGKRGETRLAVLVLVTDLRQRTNMEEAAVRASELWAGDDN